MTDFEIVPKVDETREFIEIANDFSNPLDLVREAISNSFDAIAIHIEILFSTVLEYGETISVITIKDDGDGMSREGLQAFFDLGNSPRRGDPNTIGEKGHGTKVYFNSKSIEVKTTQSGVTLHALVSEPFKHLHDGEVPIVKVHEETTGAKAGTEIIIKGYNNNRRDKFTHELVKDYIYWFTKFGSIETAFSPNSTNKYTKLTLKGLDKEEPEILNFGHYFPENSPNIQDLLDQYLTKAPDYYCKKIIKSGSLKSYPEISYDAIFSIEGTRIKYEYNKMLKRPGYSPPRGAYTISERYGVWLSKDFIPIQRKNEWITTKGSEYTKFHAFFNCQNLRLTANRGSADNTPIEVLQEIRDEIVSIYNEIIESDDWHNIEWLEEEAEAYNTTEKEKKDFVWKERRANSANVAEYKDHVLVEPQKESGVFALIIQLLMIDPNIFPFEIVDYDTHLGLDVIVKGDRRAPIVQSKLYYLELKHSLSRNFNHSFANLHSVVCWDTEIKDGETVEDIAKEERKMHIATPERKEDYTKYFLDHPRHAHKIEVFVLKDYLHEKLGLEFRPRQTISSALHRKNT